MLARIDERTKYTAEAVGELREDFKTMQAAQAEHVRRDEVDERLGEVWNKTNEHTDRIAASEKRIAGKVCSEDLDDKLKGYVTAEGFEPVRRFHRTMTLAVTLAIIAAILALVMSRPARGSERGWGMEVATP